MDEMITRWMNEETKWMDGWMDRNKKKVKETDQDMDGKLNYTHA